MDLHAMEKINDGTNQLNQSQLMDISGETSTPLFWLMSQRALQDLGMSDDAIATYLKNYGNYFARTEERIA